MTREEAHEVFFANCQYSYTDEILPKESYDECVDEIYDDFENASCNNCKWLQDEVCTNSESTKCADFPDLEMMCNKWEKNDV